MPQKQHQHQKPPLLERGSTAVAHWTGGTSAFVLACSVILVWLATGPLFHYSDTWQLVINTGTTVVTFLMVFLIQRSQNKESLAVQLKLNELVSALKGANNRLIDVEELGEEELRVLHTHYAKLAALAESEAPISESHSAARASSRHDWKRRRKRP
ncbi:MAG: low affinity iron permease family protein [Vicinamibacterales bacterium]